MICHGLGPLGTGGESDPTLSWWNVLLRPVARTHTLTHNTRFVTHSCSMSTGKGRQQRGRATSHRQPRWSSTTSGNVSSARSVASRRNVSSSKLAPKPRALALSRSAKLKRRSCSNVLTWKEQQKRQRNKKRKTGWPPCPRSSSFPAISLPDPRLSLKPLSRSNRWPQRRLTSHMCRRRVRCRVSMQAARGGSSTRSRMQALMERKKQRQRSRSRCRSRSRFRAQAFRNVRKQRPRAGRERRSRLRLAGRRRRLQRTRRWQRMQPCLMQRSQECLKMLPQKLRPEGYMQAQPRRKRQARGRGRSRIRVRVELMQESRRSSSLPVKLFLATLPHRRSRKWTHGYRKWSRRGMPPPPARLQQRPRRSKSKRMCRMKPTGSMRVRP